MEKMVKIYKKRGETPLSALERFRVDSGIEKEVPMTYAGRLDPLAEGELIILVGDECKNKEKYTGLDKEYELEILFGFSTDTGDVLGLVVDSIKVEQYSVLNTKIVNSFVGKHVWKYPNYSSKTVKGKPLFQYALEGNGHLVDVPTKQIEIYSIDLCESRTISRGVLLLEIVNSVGLVGGDFRQTEICEKWKNILSGTSHEFFVIQKIRVKCSSGTYMRTLAEKLGEAVGVPTLAYHIKRTKIFE